MKTKCRILPRVYFNRPTVTVARSLIGKYLVRVVDGRMLAGKIVEVEAYIGPDDKADRKSTRLNSSHLVISYAVFCLKKKKKNRLRFVIQRYLLPLFPLQVLRFVIPIFWFWHRCYVICILMRRVDMCRGSTPLLSLDR